MISDFSKPPFLFIQKHILVWFSNFLAVSLFVSIGLWVWFLDPVYFYIYDFSSTPSEINLMRIVSLIFLISGFFHGISILPIGFHNYLTRLYTKNQTLRWFEYGITASLMIVTGFLLVGLQDVYFISLIFFVHYSALKMISCIEKNRYNSSKWDIFIWSVSLAIIPWIMFLGLYVSGYFKPDYAGVIAVMFACFTLFPINLILDFKEVGPWKNYFFTEIIYILISMLSKTVLLYQLLVLFNF